MTYTRVPDDHVATIVTHLEMTKRPLLAPVPRSSLQLMRLSPCPLPDYRSLFARVGVPWLWFSRAIMDDVTLSIIVNDTAVEIFAVVDGHGLEVGILELDFRRDTECEIAFFGLIPELSGSGHGRWLMAETLQRAWRRGVDRVWVHTCTLDHPSALGFYRKHGFLAVRREIETFPDPRISGHLPLEVAPQVPILTRR
jgi:GNAT superfamily N-acetyltransferase